MIDLAGQAEGIIKLALAEDLGVEGDVTTKACCSSGAKAEAELIVREACTVAGQQVAERVFELAGYNGSYAVMVKDGDTASPDQVIARIKGELEGILAGERTAINFISHLTGIATLTARIVAITEPKGVKLLDTRKTMPGMRVLEKYAVKTGGGTNHRQGLFDGVIIKDNHIASAGGLELAVRRVKNFLGDRFPVEVEASNFSEVREAVDSQADIIMLDNMDVSEVEKALAIIDGKAKVEISGGVNGNNIGSYADTGVDFISMGSITHSAPAADMSLRIEPAAD